MSKITQSKIYKYIAAIDICCSYNGLLFDATISRGKFLHNQNIKLQIIEDE